MHRRTCGAVSAGCLSAWRPSSLHEPLIEAESQGTTMRVGAADTTRLESPPICDPEQRNDSIDRLEHCSFEARAAAPRCVRAPPRWTPTGSPVRPELTAPLRGP